MADSLHSKVKSKDMYWFAHGGEPLPDKIPQQRSDGDDEVGSPEQHNSPSWKPLQERKVLPEEVRGSLMGKECAASVMADGTDNSPLLSSMERDDRVAAVPDATMCGNTGRAAKHMDDEKSKKVSDPEQDKNDIKAKKKMERDAAVEARRNAQRSNVSFAFGSSLPRNLDLDVTTVYQGSDLDRNKRRISQAPAATQRPEEGRLAPMHKSPYATSENMQADKMLFQSPVIQPSNCLFGSGALVADDKMSQSMISPMSACRGRRKTDLTPTIPYDRTAPPRTPVPSASSGKRSVSMTRLDQLARPRRSYVEAQRDHAKANSTSSNSSVQKEMQCSPSRPRSSASEHSVSSNRPSTTPPVNMRARTTARKPRPVSIAGTMPDRKSNVEFKKDLGTHRTPEKKKEVSTTKKVPAVNKPKSPASKNISAEKPGQKTPIKHLTPKSSPIRKPSTKSKKSATPAAHAPVEMMNSSAEEVLKAPSESVAAAADEENGSNIPESSSKRIISEEEARAALAEKRRLAREQAEREAELERQRQEELRHQEEERIRKEEEEQRKMEEEQLRLLEEHKRQEEEKLRKAIEEQERKEQEEKLKREEEARLKAEQEKKAKEEAERQRIELEEKLRKEEEERAERKKRLEKIMSRTRGRSATSSHSGDQSDSADSQAGEAAEALSGNSSLNSIQSTDPSSGSTSLDIHPAESSQGSEHESLNSMDMIALSENSSLDSNLLMLPSDGPVSLDSDQASILSSQNFPCDEKVVSVDQNVVFSASGDNPSSCSSENETVCTDTTVILGDEKKIHDYSLVPQSESNLDSASGKLLNFDTDTVQTLVSESGDVCTENVSFPSSNQLIVENSDTSTTSHVVENLAPVSSECFTIEKKEDDTEPKHDSFTKSHEEINIPQSERYAEHDSFSAEAPVDALCSEASAAHESTIDSGNLNKLEKEQNVDSAELKTSPLIPPSESINLGEECNSKDADQCVEMSVTDTNKLDEDNVVPSPLQLERDHIPIKDDESFNKIFDGNSEHCVESCDVPQLLDLSERIVDGNSENVGSITLSQPITPPGTGPFDENTEQYINNVDMSRSLNVVFSPSAEIKPVIGSGDNSLFPKERDSAMISMEDSAGVTTSVKILEPSAIHTKANQSGEYFVAASVTDSEDSSLDSNLSQIMNVNIIQSVTSVEKGALNGSPSDTAAELPDKNSDLSTSSLPFQKLPPYVNDNIPTTNGHQSCMVESFSYGNGVDDDCKTSSLTGDHHPVSSLINNEINSNIVSSINNRNVQNILNSGDINFNKVPSNPFLTTNEASEVSENQLLNQEEIVRNPFQTESHA